MWIISASGWLFKRNLFKPLFRNQGFIQRRQELRNIVEKMNTDFEVLQ
jgi:hypothetical protein